MFFHLLFIFKIQKVNDLRRTPRDYEDEPMEWIPDSILHCDQIDHCLVIDTNIYLSNLNLITIILDKHIHGKIYNNSVLNTFVYKIYFIQIMVTLLLCYHGKSYKSLIA